jgi:hypothetical protein
MEKQMDNSVSYQIGMLFSGLVAGGGLTAKFLNRKKDGCQDVSCHDKVLSQGKAINELKKNVNDDIYPKINQTAEDVKYIRGWIDGQKK